MTQAENPRPKSDYIPTRTVPVPKADALPPANGSPETGGRGGLEPTRYGDWESKGIAVDF
jgi:hypothetical protein